MKQKELKGYLDGLVDRYNRPEFITCDPILVPHRYTKKQDIEIAGLIAAVFAWGQRKTIINKASEFLALMDNDPHNFILSHQERDLRPFLSFKHRTFNATDALYFVEFFKFYYQQSESLEEVFRIRANSTLRASLIRFFDLFFSLPDHPRRTYKHIPNPIRKSACKRINMYLRWMVRQDGKGVDFGIWKNIHPKELICPCDLHVDRVARRLKLIKRKQLDWETAEELTGNLRKLDPEDPVKYDFALFGLGIEKKQ